MTCSFAVYTVGLQSLPPCQVRHELTGCAQEGRLAELSAHVSGALGAEGAEAAEGAAGATGSGVRGDRELLETVLAEAPQMLPFEDRDST